MSVVSKYSFGFLAFAYYWIRMLPRKWDMMPYCDEVTGQQE